LLLNTRIVFAFPTVAGPNEPETERHEGRRVEQHAPVEQIGGRRELQERERRARVKRREPKRGTKRK